MKYAIIFLSLTLIASATYAFAIETDFQIIIEKKNREAILECVENVHTSTGTARILQEQIEKCTKIELITITWTHSTGITVPPSKSVEEEKQKFNLAKLHQKICKKQINSPLCKDRAIFDRLYQITEERIPGKQFFPILLGMTNSESSLGLDMAKDKVGGFCHGRNNWWGAKYQILDNNTRVYKRELNWFSYKYPIDQFWCNLYPFESIEEYWTSKVNWIRYGYKGCIDSKTPIACISVHYVWSEKVVKPQWVKNASIFIE